MITIVVLWNHKPVLPIAVYIEYFLDAKTGLGVDRRLSVTEAAPELPEVHRLQNFQLLILIRRLLLALCVEHWRQAVPSGLKRIVASLLRVPLARLAHQLLGRGFRRLCAAELLTLVPRHMALDLFVTEEGVGRDAKITPLLMRHQLGPRHAKIEDLLAFRGLSGCWRRQRLRVLDGCVPILANQLLIALLEHLVLLCTKLFQPCPHVLPIFSDFLLERDLLQEQLFVLHAQRLVNQELLNRLDIHETEPFAAVNIVRGLALLLFPRGASLVWLFALLVELAIVVGTLLEFSLGFIENMVQIAATTARRSLPLGIIAMQQRA